MFPIITIFGRDIPLYAVMAFMGAAAMILLSVFIAKKRGKIPSEDIFFMLLFAGIGCLIGAKLLYIIISVDVYWQPELSLSENLENWYIILTQGGLVFYGGLIGAFLGAFIYTKKYKLPIIESIETVVPAVPLFHAFGRVGCFLSGCCYGMEYDGLCSVTFTHALAAPNNVSLFPTQMTEAIFNTILCIILCIIYFKKPRKGIVSGVYLISYSVMRFVLEFFRGDIIRGEAWIFSTSQWISFLTLAAGIFMVLYKGRKSI